MTKSSYTGEENDIILLQQQLAASEEARYQQSLSNGQLQEDQVGSLKRQIAELQVENGRYKQRMDKVSKELDDSQQHAQQLERVIRFLREKQEEAQLETGQFQEEFQKAQLVIVDQVEKIKIADLAKQAFEEAIQQERVAKQEALDEVQALSSQFQSLKKMLAEGKRQIDLCNAQRQEAEAATEILKAEKKQLEGALREKDSGFAIFENEMADIKQSLIMGMREARDIEARYHEALKDKSSAFHLMHQMQQQLEIHREEAALLRKQQIEFEELRKQYEASEKILAQNKLLEEELVAFRNERMEISSRLEDMQRRKKDLEELLQHKDEQIALYKRDQDEAEKRYLQLSNEKQLIHETSLKAQVLQEEAEARLKIAQQHLAKKVKETSDLNDKLHSQELVMQDLQSNLNQTRLRISEQQQVLDGHLQQEKRLQDQLLEVTRSAEVITSKWEEKYFKVYERWQENEMRVKDLKKLEEKHVQMQALLSNIGGIFGSPINYSTNRSASPAPFVEEIPVSNQAETHDNLSLHSPEWIDSSPQKEMHQELQSSAQEKCDVRGPYQNLFDMPKQIKRPKHNLFE